MARHFRSGFDTMIREAELEDMEKKWKADNERIMREHPRAGAIAEAWPEPIADEPPPPPKPARRRRRPQGAAGARPARAARAAPPIPAPKRRRRPGETP